VVGLVGHVRLSPPLALSSLHLSKAVDKNLDAKLFTTLYNFHSIQSQNFAKMAMLL